MQGSAINHEGGTKDATLQILKSSEGPSKQNLGDGVVVIVGGDGDGVDVDEDEDGAMSEKQLGKDTHVATHRPLCVLECYWRCSFLHRATTKTSHCKTHRKKHPDPV
jgi:hypothetical protein